MKLIACHVENFGKLSNLSMNFSEGINVINESNAWGKSTLAAFLKAMFYGLDAKKEAGAFEKERVLYRPWQGGSFGGELDFEVNGKRYRISRSFGKTEKSDEFHLYDLSTNLECNDYTEEIGLELFDLDSASFKRSIYIAQNDCVSEASDRMNAKLGNLAENHDDINNFENANNRMKELLNQLTPDRVTGSIKRRKGEITQLMQEIRIYESASDGLNGVQQKEHVVSTQIQELVDIRKSYAQALVVASEDSRRRELYAQYDALCQDTNTKEAQLKELALNFPMGIPTGEEIHSQIEIARQMDEKKAVLRGIELSIEEHELWGKLQEMFEEEVPTAKNIDLSLEMLVDVDKQKAEVARQEAKLDLLEADLNKEVEMPDFKGVLGYKVFFTVGIVAILACALAVAGWYFTILPITNLQIFFVAVAFVAMCGLCFSLIGGLLALKNSKEKKNWLKANQEEHDGILADYKDLKEKVESLKEGINQVNGTIGVFLGKFHVYCKVEEYSAKLYELKNQVAEYWRLEQKVNESMKEREDFKEYKAKLVTFEKQYGLSLEENYSASLTMIQTKLSEYQMAQKAYNDAESKQKDFEERQEPSFWSREALCPYSIDELNLMIQQADVKLEELKAAKSQYTKQLEDLQEQLDARDEKQAELEELQDLQEQDIRKYNLIKTTQEYLQRAKEQFTARYMEPISRGFSKYYQMLTGDTQENWVIDANINLKVREQGELRETKWLSAGYQDLVGVCMRLALVDAMYEEEKPFLILDDPFVNLDKEKVECGNKLLLAVADEYQIIYFTCHDSRSPM